MESLGIAGLMLLAIFAIVRPITRYWAYRPQHTRPAILRYSERARLIDFLMWILLIAGGFLIFNWSPTVAIVMVILVICFDFMMRLLLLHLEVRRFKREDPKCSTVRARRHIRDRARSLLSS